MDELNVTYESIDSNNLLSNDLKGNFKQLVTIFHQSFGEVGLENFNENIKGLKIQKGNKYITKETIDYNAIDNVIYLNEEKLVSAPDGVAAHEMMYTTVAMTATKDKKIGFDQDGKVRCLNVGVTEMIANALVPNNSDEKDSRRKLAAIANEVLTPTMSADEVTKAYFQGDQKSIEAAVDATKNSETARNIIDTLNYGMELKGLVNYDKIVDAVQVQYNAQNIKEKIEILDESFAMTR